MVTQDKFIELTAKITKRGKSCILRSIWLVSLPLILLIFAYLGFLDVLNFRVELHSIVMLSAIFVIYLFFMKHNAYYAVCKFRSGFLNIQQDLMQFINRNLLDIGGIQKASASIDDFLQNHLLTMRNDNFSSVASGIFPTLGILGTFISIAMSMPDFTSQSSEALEHEISTLLGGVGTAFYISIYGIFLSIWWIFFEKSGLSKLDLDINTIKYDTADLFWQKEEVEQVYFRKSLENYERLNYVFDNIASSEFTNSLNKTLEQRMELFEQIIEQELSSAKGVGIILDESRQKLNLFALQQRDLTAELAQMISSLKELTKNITQSSTTTNLQHQELAVQNGASAAVAKELAVSVEALNTTLQNLNAQNIENLYSGVVGNIDKLKSELDGLGENLSRHLDSLDEKVLKKLQEALQAVDKQTTQIISDFKDKS